MISYVILEISNKLQTLKRGRALSESRKDFV